jgi:hypothetical protein
MNWIHAMENIADQHTDAVRFIRYQIEEIDNTAHATNLSLETVDQQQHSSDESRSR